MTAIVAYPGIGAIFNWDSEDIAEITHIGGPNVMMDTIEASHLNSADNFKEYIAGLLDGGEITLEGNLTLGSSTTLNSMYTDMLARSSKTWLIKFPTSVTVTWTGTGFITAFTPDLPGDKATISMTIKITGKATLAATASAGLSAMSVAKNSGAATLVPAFGAAVYAYNVSVLTTETWVTITSTFAAGTCTITCGTQSQTVASTVASTQITLGAADSLTVITVTQKDPNEVAKVYTINVARP